MKYAKNYLTLIVLAGLIASCDQLLPGQGDEPTGTEPTTGTLDMAFVYRAQGVRGSGVKKVQLSLAYTADYLYEGRFFIQANVSDAVTHYRFELPPGEYYYYAKVLCQCGGDTCQYLGFSMEDGTMAAGGKVSVEVGKISSFTTNFH